MSLLIEEINGLSSKKIISMLGTIDDIFLVSILNALAENNGSKVIELSKEMNQKSKHNDFNWCRGKWEH